MITMDSGIYVIMLAVLSPMFVAGIFSVHKQILYRLSTARKDVLPSMLTHKQYVRCLEDDPYETAMNIQFAERNKHSRLAWRYVYGSIFVFVILVICSFLIFHNVLTNGQYELSESLLQLKSQLS